MSESMRIGHILPVKASLLQNQQKAQTANTAPASEFNKLLKASELNFSHHAETRMKQRGIQLQPEALSKIMDAVKEAETKGAVDSLIVLKDVAMIVNVPSRTVVTAMDGTQLHSNVFTQIDSAVIIN
ncbi:TIGR02530 family flagellar biosynthesis protein [Paenibacillus sp. NPDC058071]|uniref:TIGR02530 family flagellar biosynthesis protein n=1 Tax=Paenibacillus sp. NPDC058071 TaxID=3346326 RepID=UPI0036DF2F04